MKINAFTLAETLIVIGIIGVVAALTLPNLNHATGDKEKVTKVKKIYSTLTEALDRAQAVYGAYDTWYNGLSTESEKSERLAKRMSEFMKVSKDCITAPSSNCWSGYGATWYNQRGSLAGSAVFYSSILISDSMSIAFGSRLSVNDPSNFIYVDIDGPKKGPFRFGTDIFLFKIVNNQLEPGHYASSNKLCSNISFSTLVSYLYNSAFCQSYWIITHDNMDYTKFTSESGTCENGNRVTESHPSCN